MPRLYLRHWLISFPDFSYTQIASTSSRRGNCFVCGVMVSIWSKTSRLRKVVFVERCRLLGSKMWQWTLHCRYVPQDFVFCRLFCLLYDILAYSAHHILSSPCSNVFISDPFSSFVRIRKSESDKNSTFYFISTNTNQQYENLMITLLFSKE